MKPGRASKERTYFSNFRARFIKTLFSSPVKVFPSSSCCCCTCCCTSSPISSELGPPAPGPPIDTSKGEAINGEREWSDTME